MNLIHALALSVPLAFVLGWWASRRMGAKRSGAEVSELSSLVRLCEIEEDVDVAGLEALQELVKGPHAH